MPQTLRQMAGAAPHALASSALLFTDAQLEYLSALMICPGVEASLDQGNRSLARARRNGRPVLHVRHKGKPGGLFDPESGNFEIAHTADDIP